MFYIIIVTQSTNRDHPSSFESGHSANAKSWPGSDNASILSMHVSELLDYVYTAVNDQCSSIRSCGELILA
jgi:hypothetical protein